MAGEYLPENFYIKQMRAEYKSQARLGDTIFPAVYKQEDRWVITLSNKEGKPYCIVEFS